MFKIVNVIGHSCPNNYLLMKDDTPIVFTRGHRLASECLLYIEGYDVEILDGRVKKELDRYRKTNIKTKGDVE